MKGFRGGTIMHDVIEVFGNGSLVQHGKHNDRVYLMKLSDQDIDDIIQQISNVAHTNNYSKIFCKVPKSSAPQFFANGFILEACIPKFYNSMQDVFFVSKFLNSDRLLNLEQKQLYDLSHLLKEKQSPKESQLSPEYSIRQLNNADVDQITDIYREVFETYPFPIHNPEYILKTMSENLQYFGAEKDGKLVALASAEMDMDGKNVEMTDFSTLNGHAGKNLAINILKVMEKQMKRIGIKTFYTIARLNSIPMNKTFLRCNYTYSGTLIKNTNISGNIESMNVYYKHI